MTRWLCKSFCCLIAVLSLINFKLIELKLIFFCGIDDIILSEYGTTVVGLEMLRSVNEESAEENRKKQIVKSAISTLSYSELEAIVHIFRELDGNEGVLVASKIARRPGILKSIWPSMRRSFLTTGRQRPP